MTKLIKKKKKKRVELNLAKSLLRNTHMLLNNKVFSSRLPQTYLHDSKMGGRACGGGGETGTSLKRTLSGLE